MKGDITWYVTNSNVRPSPSEWKIFPFSTRRHCSDTEGKMGPIVLGISAGGRPSSLLTQRCRAVNLPVRRPCLSVASATPKSLPDIGAPIKAEEQRPAALEGAIVTLTDSISNVDTASVPAKGNSGLICSLLLNENTFACSKARSQNTGRFFGFRLPSKRPVKGYETHLQPSISLGRTENFDRSTAPAECQSLNYSQVFGG